MRKLAWSSFVLGAAVLVGGIRCGGDERVEKDGGAGGQGGSPGSAGAAGLGGSSGVANGGQGTDGGDGGATVASSGGSAGSTSDPFADAPEAEWEPFGTFGTCPVDRLVDPGQHTLLYWEPCEGIQGCEIAVTNPKLLELSGLVYYPLPNSSVTGDGGTSFGLVFQGIQSYAVFAEGDGQVIDGFRNTQVVGEDNCSFGGAPTSATRYAFSISRVEDGNPFVPTGGALFDRATREQTAVLQIDESVPGAASNRILGTERLGFTYGLPSRQASLSLADGGDFRLFASSTGIITDMSEMITTGPQFLFLASTTETPSRYIMASDGIEPPMAYIRAEDGSYTGEPGYAHGRIVWQKGINPESANHFERVELWASEYDPDPDKLQPHKVADLEEQYMPLSFAGWNHYANHIFAVDTSDSTLRIWNVITGMHHDYFVPATFRRIRRLIGMTPEHLYVVADHAQGLLRLEVE